MNRTTPTFCDYCSTIEGESELSRNKHRTTVHQVTILYHNQNHIPSHWCCDERPCSGTVPYLEGIALIQLPQDTACNSLGYDPVCRYPQ